MAGKGGTNSPSKTNTSRVRSTSRDVLPQAITSTSFNRELLPMLDQYAEAYEINPAQFREACGCANLIMICAPQLPTGYQRLARLYMMDGKSAAALKVLNSALENVPKTSEGYTDLKTARDEADRRAHTGVDFITKIAPEIIQNIMEKIAFRDRLTCVGLSRSWQHYLVHRAAATWADAYICEPFGKWGTMKLVLKHTKAMRIGPGYNNEVQHIFQYCVPRPYGFQNLESLILEDLSLYCQSDLDTLAITLRNIPSLRRLSISFSHSFIPILDLLSICPKLKSFVYRRGVFDIPMTFKRRMTIPDVFMLETLAIFREKILPNDGINEIIKRSPFMRNLNLSKTDHTFLQVVHASCPNINVLVANYEKFPNPIDDYSVQEPYTKEGLSTLAVRVDDSYPLAYVDRLTSLINDNWDSLTIIDLGLSLELGLPMQIKQGCTAERLSRISIRSLSLHAQRDFISLLHRSPLVSSVTFEIASLTLAAEFFNALRTLENFSELKLVQTYSPISDLCNFIEHHIRLGVKSTLRSLAFGWRTTIEDSVFTKIAALKQLETFRATDCFNVSRDALSDLVDSFIASQTVTTLQLANLKGLCGPILSKIGDIASLRYLTLGGDWSDTFDVDDDGIFRVLDKAHNLKTLTICRCPGVSECIWEDYPTATKISFELAIDDTI